MLAGDCENTEIVARVKSDYRETLSDLVLESFIQPMTEWANRHGSLNRNQAHGSPANILDLYAACDIPETEIYKTGNRSGVHILVNKFASSAAHVTGKNLVSSESFTWLGEHWNVTPDDMIRATNRLFPVSYTHLDVYKRQLHTLPVSGSFLRTVFKSFQIDGTGNKTFHFCQ